MSTLVARIFPEQSHDAVLFWDCNVLSKLLGIEVLSSTILSGHTHLLRFESEGDSSYVRDKFHNMPVGDGILLQLEEFKTAHPKPPVSHPSPQAFPQADIHSTSNYFWFQGVSKRTQLVVELADALDLPVDSLVYPTDESFTFDGGLAKCIAESAGHEFIREVHRVVKCSNAKLNIGDAIITGSGLLASSRITTIVHALIPYYQHRDQTRLMCSAVRNALCRADERGAQSVGITVMGSGRFCWPEDHAAASIIDSILACLRDGVLLSVTEVRIFDQEPAKIAAVLRHVHAQCTADLVPAAARPSATVRSARPTRAPVRAAMFAVCIQQTGFWRHPADWPLAASSRLALPGGPCPHALSLYLRPHPPLPRAHMDSGRSSP
jgi:O-acetyl-ADP-ribose deacetylase (regulator of RNase III)